jgi:transposase
MINSNTPGGQLGHPGKTLDFFENPDHVIDILIDHALLQDGHVYKSCGYMRRQVVDIKIQRVITEYRAEILEDQNLKHMGHLLVKIVDGPST